MAGLTADPPPVGLNRPKDRGVHRERWGDGVAELPLNERDEVNRNLSLESHKPFSRVLMQK